MPRPKRKLDLVESSDEDIELTTNKAGKQRRVTSKPTVKKLNVVESSDEDIELSKNKAGKQRRVTSKPTAKRLNVVESSDEDIELTTNKGGKQRRVTSKSIMKRLNVKDSIEVPEKKRKLNERNPTTEQSSRSQPWNEAELLSGSYNISKNIMENIVELFQKDNTIPFMCRYRKDLIGNILPDKMRDIKASYNHLLKLKDKQETVIKKLEKENVLSDELRENILAVRSSEELEHLYEPFKSTSKSSLAERAKSKGLQDVSEQILCGRDIVNLHDFVNPANGLDDIQSVREGVKHIILSVINKDADVLEEMRRLLKTQSIRINSTLIKQTKSSKNGPQSSNNTDQNTGKFETYFDFHTTVVMIKPHQTLAINRGESQKILKVTVEFPDRCKLALYDFLYKKYYLNQGVSYAERDELLKLSFNESISKKLQPLMTRRIRKDLTKTAEKASIDVFATNLKQLLLTSPLKGQRILGIDPGFTNGCKIAIISECMDVLATDVIYPHTKSNQNLKCGNILAKMMSKYDCTTIALGNGTACRETEKWLSDLFNQGILDSKQIRYSIVNEQGTSIYSCSDLAKKEFPDLDVNLISAVARRLSDPLGELVKVEPKHLGVGMYQHDIDEKYLTESLNEVVMECVSFVGVDINTTSVTLLRHIAGLTPARAENICKYRTTNGPFKSREEIKKVKLIGDKTFEQCAGFLRIEPRTERDKDYNLFDSTWIHPESYKLAEEIMKKCKLKKDNIGSSEFIAKIKEFTDSNTLEQLAKEFNRPKERIETVLEALARELLRDYRDDLVKKPLFKQGLTKMSDLLVDTVVTGGITNVTHFGCFVDIGVGRDALIHSSKLQGKTPRIGDRVEAVVLNVDVDRGRINLKLTNIF